MSDLLERHMHGAYVGKQEYLNAPDEDLDRIAHADAVYPTAMAAMEAHERLMERCKCDYDLNWHDVVVRQPNPECPVHAEEDREQ